MPLKASKTPSECQTGNHQRRSSPHRWNWCARQKVRSKSKKSLKKMAHREQIDGLLFPFGQGRAEYECGG